ncbi:WD40 repeat-like protein, partial [Dissoconium aciculare CBS 342.82]|uniref:WD40 repeat-like protein n=1 Tax=Dissoconium aciculare CBS 342.82 TaxID=1314786 RepID=A0A6J3M839_9PEZI
VQIVTGSYERVLHGIAATIPRAKLDTPSTSDSSESDVAFSDNFLFAAHSSAIRCLAISPATEEADKRILATGSSDERINVYSLSTAPLSAADQRSGPRLPVLSGATSSTAENPRNRSLGSLNHHDRAITSLAFPTKSKLFSSAEDATIAISRTRDWTMLSSIKAPIPKPQGRPSGDTAGPGEIPAGVNAFAIHPSQKLMLSVGRGEKCMRLWNLMTGKKAGVLNFDRELLMQVGEGKYSSGEGRRLLWDDAGEHFIVGFEKGAVVFGIDSKPKAVIRPEPRTKIHQMRLVPSASVDASRNLVAISAEDGRVLFYDISALPDTPEDAAKLPQIPCRGALGGPGAGIAGRVKDFEMLAIPGETPSLLVITASSDGALRLWSISDKDMTESNGNGEETQQLGMLIATLETGERITCLGAFVLDGKGTEDDDDE